MNPEDIKYLNLSPAVLAAIARARAIVGASPTAIIEAVMADWSRGRLYVPTQVD